MNTATDEALEKIVRAYFIARQAIAVGKPTAKVMKEFDQTASRVFFNAPFQDNERSPARIEHKKLRALLVTYEPDGFEKRSLFSFSWLRPLFYCFTGSVCCVALLIVANHSG
jgi:hypothetical protein